MKYFSIKHKKLFRKLIIENIFDTIILIILMSYCVNSRNLRSLQNESTINTKKLNNLKSLVDNDFLLKEGFKDILSPENPNFKPLNYTIIENKKPELLIINDTDKTTLIISNKVVIEDYSYTGALGLGAGVIAVIVFMIIGLLICIIGLATEYSV